VDDINPSFPTTARCDDNTQALEKPDPFSIGDDGADGRRGCRVAPVCGCVCMLPLRPLGLSGQHPPW
jgi:hypothetical protein